MKPRILFVLTALNLALLLLTVAQQFRPAFAQSELPVLRGRGLEIVDTQGRVRASIEVLPPIKSQKGEEEAEAVLLRLITERGRPSVKITSSEPASGLSFAGPTGTKNSWLTLGSNATTSALKLRSENGREHTIAP